jgi:hypothetical protein
MNILLLLVYMDSIYSNLAEINGKLKILIEKSFSYRFPIPKKPVPY